MQALKPMAAHAPQMKAYPARPNQTLALCSTSTPNASTSSPTPAPQEGRYTMSQVYVKDRPAPIPHSEHDRRRRVRDLEEITSAGKKRGVSAQLIASNLEQVEALLPGLVNLHKAKAADWLLILSDVNAFTAKLILLRELFPSANLQKVLASQPKLMLKTQEQLKEEAAQVRKILSSAPNPDAIIEACPDLINPVSLMRSLALIERTFRGSDPVEMLAKNPGVLMESSVEPVTEYGSHPPSSWTPP